MSTDRNRIAALFAAAVAKPIEQQAAYLDHACGGDADLRAASFSCLKWNSESS